MKVDNRDIFEQIGNLFYAIAAEQRVKPIEVGELKSLVSKDWLPRTPLGNDFVISNETNCILLAMDTLEGNRTAAKDAYIEFAKFFSMHPEVFTNEVRERILNTAVDITRIFKADNPGENVQLTALKDLLGLRVENA